MVRVLKAISNFVVGSPIQDIFLRLRACRVEPSTGDERPQHAALLESLIALELLFSIEFQALLNGFAIPTVVPARPTNRTTMGLHSCQLFQFVQLVF